MKVFITGAAGFLGRYVAEEFRRADCEVSGVDMVSADNSSLHPHEKYLKARLPDKALGDFIGQVRPDICVHCAGGASVQASLENPEADFRSSVVVTEHLLTHIKRGAPGCRMIFLSSAAVYGQPSKLPVGEDAPINPISPYGYHKRICELLFEQAAKVLGTPSTILRIFSAYGPGLRRQVLWEVASQLASGECLKLKGTGDETRDFIHATDIARAVRFVADNAPGHGEVFNLAAGQETSIREAAELMSSFFPDAKPPQFKGCPIAGDPQRWQADCTRLCALGFVPKMPLTSGFASLAEWAKRQRPKAC